MRFGFLVVAAAAAGVLAVAALPSGILQKAGAAVRAAAGQVAQVNLADLNPLRAVFDYDQAQIMKGQTPESLGFKPGPLVITSFPTPRPYQGLTYNSGLQNGQTTTPQNPPR